MTRGESAGHKMAKAIIEMVNLMYQNNTALHFYSGLMATITMEFRNRDLAKQKEQRVL